MSYTENYQKWLDFAELPAYLRDDFLVSRGTPDPARRVSDFMYEAFTLSGGTSQTLLLSSTLPYRSPYPVVHAQRFGHFRVRSPLLTESMFLSLPPPT